MIYENKGISFWVFWILKAIDFSNQNIATILKTWNSENWRLVISFARNMPQIKNFWDVAENFYFLKQKVLEIF